MDIRIGDILKMKKEPPLRSVPLGGQANRCGLPAEVHGLWSRDHAPRIKAEKNIRAMIRGGEQVFPQVK